MCLQNCVAPECYGSQKANGRQLKSLKGTEKRLLDKQNKTHTYETAGNLCAHMQHVSDWTLKFQ